MVTFFAILSIAASAVSFFMGSMVFFKSPRNHLNIIFLLLCYVVAFWGFTEYHSRTASDIDSAHAWIHLNFFWAFSTALLLHFVFVFTRKDRLLRNPLTYAALYLPAAAITILFIFTGTISPAPVLEPWGWTFGSQRTLIGNASVAWVSLLGLVAAIVCFVYYLRLEDPEKKKQTGLIVLGISLPVIAGSVTDALIPLLGFRVPELTVITFSIGVGGFIGVAIWKYELFTLSPTTAAEEIIATLTDSLLLIDPDCRIITANRAAEELLGYRTDQLSGRRMETIFSNSDDSNECHNLMYDESVTGANSIDMKWETRKGQTVPVSLSLSKFKDKEGKLRGFICVARDISEQQHREANLQQKTHDLGERVKELNCLYAITNLFQNKDSTLKEIYSAVVKLVPHAMQFPELAEIRLRIYDNVMESQDFQETPWRLAHPIMVRNKEVGSLEVYYREETHGQGQGTFLEEEKNLVDSIAFRLGQFVENRQIEKELEESELRYRTLFDTSPDGIAITDLEGTITMCNDSLAHIMGYDSGAEMVGLKNTEFVEPADRERIAKTIPAVLDSGIRDIEIAFLRKAGSTGISEISVSAINGPDGKPEALVAIVHDVTERKAAEQAIRESEERYRTLFETSPDGIDIIDLTGKVVMCNRQNALMHGYEKPEDIVGMNALDLVAPEDRDTMDEVMKAGLSGDISIREISLLRADGSQFPAEVSGAFLHDAQGNPTGIVSILRDISDRKQAENALKESELQYRTQFETSPDGILILDLQGTILMCNSQVYRTHGFSDISQLLGKNGADFMKPEDRTRMLADLKNLVENPGEAPLVEYQLLRADGGYWPASIKGAVLTDANGAPTGFMLILRDITELKQAETELLRKDASLREAQRVAHLGHWELDLVEDELYWSDEVFRIFGLEPQAYLPTYEAFLNFVHPEDRSALEAAYTRSLKERKGYELDHRILRSDGSVRHVRERCNTEFDADGKPLRSIGTVLDITELKLVEAALAKSESRYRDLINLSPDGTTVLAMDGAIQFANTRVIEQLGFDSEEEMKSRSYLEVIVPEQRQKAADTFRKTVERGLVINEEIGLLKKDGSCLTVELNASLVTDDEGKPHSVIIVSRDISDRKLVEMEISRMADDISLINLLNDASNREDSILNMLMLMETEIRSMLDCNGTGVCLLSEDRKSLELRHFHLPPAKANLIERMTGSSLNKVKLSVDLESAEICNRLLTEGDLSQLSDPEMIGKFMNEFTGNENVASKIPSIVRIAEIRSILAVPLMVAEGSAAMLFFGRERAFSETETQRVKTISEHMAVIIDRKLLYEETKKLSLHDPLTGLANRNLMNLRLDESIARAKRTGSPVSLIMMDLDFFKDFNDTFGHSAGDDLLHEIAVLLRQEIREVDTAVRYGGEEFLVILPDTDIEVAVEVAERIRTGIEKKDFSRDGGPPLRMTVSLGISTFEEGATSVDSLITRADASLYKAKEGGRNRVERWQSENPAA